MVIVSILPHAEFGSADHREYATHVTKYWIGTSWNPNVAHKHLLHTDKLRRVKQMFAMQVLIQQQEDEIAEVRAIKGFKKKVKND